MEITPELELKWCKEDLKIAEQRYQECQRTLDILNEDWMDARAAVERAEKACPGDAA